MLKGVTAAGYDEMSLSTETVTALQKNRQELELL